MKPAKAFGYCKFDFGYKCGREVCGTYIGVYRSYDDDINSRGIVGTLENAGY
jgi:hypothetical protein